MLTIPPLPFTSRPASTRTHLRPFREHTLLVLHQPQPHHECHQLFALHQPTHNEAATQPPTTSHATASGKNQDTTPRYRHRHFTHPHHENSPTPISASRHTPKPHSDNISRHTCQHTRRSPPTPPAATRRKSPTVIHTQSTQAHKCAPAHTHRHRRTHGHFAQRHSDAQRHADTRRHSHFTRSDHTSHHACGHFTLKATTRLLPS